MPDELSNGSSMKPGNGSRTNEDLSDEELASLQAEFEGLGEDFEDIIHTFEDQTLRWRKEKGGERLSVLLTSQEESLRCLEDPDPNIRELALHLAVEHWKVCHLIRDRCERIAVHDPSVAVRCMAIGTLGKCYRGQKNGPIGAILARIVSNPDLPFEERKSAYLSLVLLNGDEERFSISDILLNFPSTIEWELINSYLSETIE